MTLKEFRERTKDLDENMELIDPHYDALIAVASFDVFKPEDYYYQDQFQFEHGYLKVYG